METNLDSETWQFNVYSLHGLDTSEGSKIVRNRTIACLDTLILTHIIDSTPRVTCDALSDLEHPDKPK